MDGVGGGEGVSADCHLYAALLSGTRIDPLAASTAS